MTFEIFNTIASSLLASIGGSAILPLIFIGVIGMLLLSIKGGYPLFIIVILPLVVSFAVVSGSSLFYEGFTEQVTVFALTAFISLGVIVAFAFWKIIR